MPPAHTYDTALISVFRLVQALWEIIVTKAQPYPVREMAWIGEMPHNRSSQCLDQKQAHPGPQPLKTRRRRRKNPSYEEVVSGVALISKHTGVWELRCDSKNPLQFGRSYPIPDTVPPHLRRRIAMFNHCDSGNLVMKPLLTKLLHILNPNIRVEWLVVIPSPHLLTNRLEGKNPTTTHSVLLITTPSGTKTVLDLTGEQFGIPVQNLISPLHEYLRKYVAKASEWSSARYTCNTEDYEKMIQEWSKEQRYEFWKTLHSLMKGLYDGWVEEVRDGWLGMGDWAGCREWMEESLALDLEGYDID